MNPKQGTITNPKLLHRIKDHESGRMPTIPVILEEIDAIIKAAEAGMLTEPLLNAISERAQNADGSALPAGPDDARL